MLKVCEKRCDECLFSDKRIVSKARFAEIMQDLARKDGHFICHKSSIRGDKDEVVCHGSYEQMPQLVRIAGRIGAIQFVDADTGVACKS